jgi:D-3-phosphoglycerate dehydrogenase
MDSSLPIALALGHRFASLDVERAVLDGVARVLDGTSLQADQLAQTLQAASAVLLGTRGRLDAAVIAKMSHCRVIVRYGVGVDNIAVDQATAQGIPVVNIPEYCVEEVSDHTVALILAANRRLIPGYQAARNGEWGPGIMKTTARLAVLTVGILGFGRIGQEVARKAQPFVERVLAYDPFVAPEDVLDKGAVPTDFEELLEASDFIIISCPLTPQTRQLFNRETFGRMKPTAWLINTARGEIINEDDLIEALESGRIQGAALDVLAKEPPVPESPLLHMDNVVVTPHVAWYSRHAVHDLQRLAAEQVRRVLTGKEPQWLVNPEVQRAGPEGRSTGDQSPGSTPLGGT